MLLLQVADLSQSTTGPSKPRYVPPHLRGRTNTGQGGEERGTEENRGGGRRYEGRGGYDDRRNGGGGRVWDEARGAYTRDDRRDGYQEDRGGFSRRLVEVPFIGKVLKKSKHKW